MKETTLVIIITQEKSNTGAITKTQLVGDEKLYKFLKEKILRDLLIEIEATR